MSARVKVVDLWGPKIAELEEKLTNGLDPNSTIKFAGITGPPLCILARAKMYWMKANKPEGETNISYQDMVESLNLIIHFSKMGANINVAIRYALVNKGIEADFLKVCKDQMTKELALAPNYGGSVDDQVGIIHGYLRGGADFFGKVNEPGEYDGLFKLVQACDDRLLRLLFFRDEPGNHALSTELLSTFVFFTGTLEKVQERILRYKGVIATRSKHPHVHQAKLDACEKIESALVGIINKGVMSADTLLSVVEELSVCLAGIKEDADHYQNVMWSVGQGFMKQVMGQLDHLVRQAQSIEEPIDDGLGVLEQTSIFGGGQGTELQSVVGFNRS